MSTYWFLNSYEQRLLRVLGLGFKQYQCHEEMLDGIRNCLSTRGYKLGDMLQYDDTDPFIYTGELCIRLELSRVALRNGNGGGTILTLPDDSYVIKWAIKLEPSAKALPMHSSELLPPYTLSTAQKRILTHLGLQGGIYLTKEAVMLAVRNKLSEKYTDGQLVKWPTNKEPYVYSSKDLDFAAHGAATYIVCNGKVLLALPETGGSIWAEVFAYSPFPSSVYVLTENEVKVAQELFARHIPIWPTRETMLHDMDIKLRELYPQGCVVKEAFTHGTERVVDHKEELVLDGTCGILYRQNAAYSTYFVYVEYPMKMAQIVPRVLTSSAVNNYHKNCFQLDAEELSNPDMFKGLITPSEELSFTAIRIPKVDIPIN